MNHPDTGRLLYAYAVARDTPALGAVALRTVTGVAGEPVRTVRHQDLTALVGAVDAADFGERALRAHLEELSWLESTARAHQRVVDAAGATGTCVLPLRLATVYRDEASVRAMLQERSTHLAATLRRLDGRVEWGVKVHARTPEAAPSAPRAPTSGRDYLRRRISARRAHEEDARRAEETAHAIHAALTALAEETRLYPPQHTGLSGRPGRNLLNAAYLVPRTAGDRFTAAVARLTGSAPADGAEVELTGPWAPYSFAGTGDAVTAQGTAGEPS
ncbi:GvpL/GvpF family gas vesicle protein [Streptomyces sp. NPDC049555]|uniref:GvpL/GvpF family gas vesicle protein n=1 Tax=Streptomyces sp. NPDC049555 TaxID=3154930 RepID=UPI003439E0F0